MNTKSSQVSTNLFGNFLCDSALKSILGTALTLVAFVNHPREALKMLSAETPLTVPLVKGHKIISSDGQFYEIFAASCSYAFPISPLFFNANSINERYNENWAQLKAMISSETSRAYLIMLIFSSKLSDNIWRAFILNLQFNYSLNWKWFENDFITCRDKRKLNWDNSWGV